MDIFGRAQQVTAEDIGTEPDAVDVSAPAVVSVHSVDVVPVVAYRAGRVPLVVLEVERAEPDGCQMSRRKSSACQGRALRMSTPSLLLSS